MRIQPIVRTAMLAGALACTAAAAGAQVPASSFEELRFVARIGQNVTVTGPDGTAVTGKLLDLSTDRLTLQVKQQPFDFDQRQVRLIQEKYSDPVGNGALAGAIWAGVPSLLLTLEICPYCLQIAVGYAAFGALIGTVVDLNVQSMRPIYLPPAGGGSRSRLIVTGGRP